MTTTTMPSLHPFPEIARRLGLPLRGMRERARAKEFEHVHIGRERYLTDEQIPALIKTFTVSKGEKTSERDAALDAVRDRVTRQQQRTRRPKAA